MDKDLFEAWDAAVVLIDNSATVRFANDAAADAFRYSRNKMEGLPARALVPPDVRERTAWYQTLHSNPGYDQYAAGVLVRCLRSDGYIFNAAVTVYPVGEAMPDAMWVMIDAVGSNRSPKMTESLPDQHEPEVAPVGEQDTWGAWLETSQRLSRSFERLALDLRSMVMADVLGIVALDSASSMVQLCHREIFQDDILDGRNVGDVYDLPGTIAAEVSAQGSPVVVTTDSAESFQKLYPGAVPDGSPSPPYLSSIAVPLRSGKQTTGMLFAHSTQREAFGQEHVEYLLEVPGIG